MAWAAFFVVIALAFTTAVDVQFTLPKLFWLRLMASIIVLLWAVRFWRGDVRPIPRFLLGAGGALLAWWIVTTVFAVDRTTAMQGMHGRYNGLVTHAILIALFFALASTPFSRRDVETLVLSFVAALTPVAIYAAAQAAGLDPTVWPNIRPGSTIGHPVPLAASLSLAVPFLLAFLFTETRTAKRWMWAGILLLFLSAIAATLSRGPWAGLVVAVAVMVVMAIRHRIVVPTASWIGVAAVILMVAIDALGGPAASLNRVRSRFEALTQLRTDPSFMGRFVYFDAAGRMLRDHPIAGIGFESYALLYPRYRPVEGEVIPADALPTMVHDGYLQMAVTNGPPALALYLTLIASIVILVWRSCCSRPATGVFDAAATSVSLMGAAFIAAIAGYLVQDLSGWLEISLSSFFWALLGAAVAFAATASRVPRPQPTAGWRLAGSVAAAGVAVALAALTIGSLKTLRADGHLFEAESRDVATDWPSIDGHLTAGLALAPGEAHYEDLAGLVYLKRMRVSGQRAAYDSASLLFDKAADHDRFDPYILIHRIDLDTAALGQRIVAGPSDSASRAAARLIDMDPNNATVHETVGRFRLAEGRADAALASIRKAEELRPSHPRYHLIEGDVFHLQGNPAAAVAPYRRETALAAGDRDWAVAEDKLILALSETRQFQPAADEAQKVVARVPADATAHALLGFAYLELGKLEPAKAAFSAALAADPTSAPARQGLLEVDRKDASARHR